jgi:hypothetical protein
MKPHEGKRVKLRFHVLTATSMEMAVLYDVVPCNLVEIDRRFRGTYCLHHHDDEAHRSYDGGSKYL